MKTLFDTKIIRFFLNIILGFNLFDKFKKIHLTSLKCMYLTVTLIDENLF